jgi:glucose-6-phosphate isomerase
MAAATALQAWAILARHARDEISYLRLQQLCGDADRVSSLVAVHNAPNDRILLVDLSRQRMTLDTLNHLLRLANARDVPKYIRRLAWGQNDPDDPVVPLRLRKQEGSPWQQMRSGKQARFEVDQGGGRARGHTAIPDARFIMPTMHLALRAPSHSGMTMLTADGKNALVGIHQDWERIERFSDALRKGQLRGATGSPIRDIIVVGRGVPVMALRFLYQALLRDAEGLAAATDGFHDPGRNRKKQDEMHRRMRFLSSLDPLAAASAVADLDPTSTMVISIALKGKEETAGATRTLKSWLLQGNGPSRRPEIIFTKHMLLVTGSERVAALNKPETVFLIPDHSRCEPFTTFTSAGLLPLSIIFGWRIVKELLAGAHDMDVHFVETNPRNNLPVLLALTDVWNDAFLGSTGRVVTPFTETFDAFPSYVAALEAQTCGRMKDGSSRLVSSSGCGLVIDGGLHGTYDRSLYQGLRVMPSELIMAMDTQVTVNTSITIGLDGVDDVISNQDAQICSFFAHADELAFGSEQPSSTTSVTPTSSFHRTESFGSTMSVLNTEASDGNRPSTLLICGKCDAFTCGQLLAMCEHRTIVRAKLFDLDPFAPEVGSSIRASRTEDLKEELHKLYTQISTTGGRDEDEESDNGPRVNVLSTSTILSHYATLMHGQRVYVVKSP